MEVSQSKFNLELNTTNTDDYKWWVPISMKSIDDDLTNTAGDERERDREREGLMERVM